MNTIRLTPEERATHDHAALLMSIPHAIAEFVNDNGEIDWDKFEHNDLELYNKYCELSIEELEECIKEAHKIGGGIPGYLTVINALREQQEDIRNTQIKF